MKKTESSSLTFNSSFPHPSKQKDVANKQPWIVCKVRNSKQKQMKK